MNHSRVDRALLSDSFHTKIWNLGGFFAREDYYIQVADGRSFTQMAEDPIISEVWFATITSAGGT
jgi:hypothetical protein